MRRLLPIVALVVSAFALAHGQNLEGVWEGEIQDPKRPIVINVDFKALRISFSGTPPTNITRGTPAAGNKRVKFDVVTGSQTLKFAGAQDGARITGEVDTGNRRMPFWLELL